ncbi:MAG: hypothetical protein OXF74_01805 [Rhodobacteraceae bacterium]|nr:hypothetical protein [Paracoccaceae bacterium]
MGSAASLAGWHGIGILDAGGDKGVGRTDVTKILPVDASDVPMHRNEHAPVRKASTIASA